MNAVALLEDMSARGVALAVRGDKLHVEAPAGLLSEADWERLAGCKANIISILSQPLAPSISRCPVCLSTGHTTPGEWCDVPSVHSCRDYPPAGSAAPLPAPADTEYEPGADWQPGEHATVDLIYREGETPARCASCGVELVNRHHSLCGPCRWERAKSRRGEPVYFDD